MQKVKYGKMEVIFGRATVRDDLHAQIINSRLNEAIPEGEFYHRGFSEFCVHVRSVKNFPFDPLALPQASKEQIYAAYCQWLELDKNFNDMSKDAVEIVDAPVDDSGLSAVSDPN